LRVSIVQRAADRARPTMTRVEFEKLTQPERNTYIRNGGKLI
jgi:hypothetical protein